MFLRRVTGILLILAAVVGILFSLTGLVVTWRYRPVATRRATDTLTLVDKALGTTQQSLNILGQVVQGSADAVTSLQTTIQTVGQAVHDSSPMLDSLIGLTKNDFPSAISATQSSLEAAQSSAQVIDNVLAALTRFAPTLYQPKVPLHTALAEVSASLDSLPTSLSAINTSLTSGKSKLAELELKMDEISATTQGISTTLGNAQEVITQYTTATNQLKAQVEAAQRSARGWILAFALLLSFVVVWILIAHLGLFLQGLEMVRGMKVEVSGERRAVNSE